MLREVTAVKEKSQHKTRMQVGDLFTLFNATSGLIPDWPQKIMDGRLVFFSLLLPLNLTSRHTLIAFYQCQHYPSKGSDDTLPCPNATIAIPGINC